MDLKTLLDEALVKGEKIKEEVMSELFKSKTIKDLVGSQNFVKAVSRIIETKDEVKKSLNKQMKAVFAMMEVPTREELLKIGSKIGKLEKIIERVGRAKLKVTQLKNHPVSHRTTKKSSAVRKSAGKKPVKQNVAKKKG